MCPRNPLVIFYRLKRSCPSLSPTHTLNWLDMAKSMILFSSLQRHPSSRFAYLSAQGGTQEFQPPPPATVSLCSTGRLSTRSWPVHLVSAGTKCQGCGKEQSGGEKRGLHAPGLQGGYAYWTGGAPFDKDCVRLTRLHSHPSLR